MSASQSFYTPSFGDEEFEISTAQESENYSLNNNSSFIRPEKKNMAKEISSFNQASDEIVDIIPVETNEIKKKTIRDPNEPQKPVSAYALFFRDTQAAIKSQNPGATFPEVSKIVSSMWDALELTHKNVYKKKTEKAKRDYIKAISAYRASLSAKNQEINSKSTQIIIDNQQKTITEDYNEGENNANQISQQNQAEDNIQLQRFSNILTDENLPQASSPKCVRNGCLNKAIINPDWEDEYCSNECVVSHCRDVFSQWVQS